MNVKSMMLIASILGAIAGVYFIDVTKPAIDFSYWSWAFAILGIGVGNLAFNTLQDLSIAQNAVASINEKIINKNRLIR